MRVITLSLLLATLLSASAQSFRNLDFEEVITNRAGLAPPRTDLPYVHGFGPAEDLLSG